MKRRRVSCIPPLYHQATLLDARMRRARDICSGKIPAQDHAEREWAKSVIYAERYNTGPLRRPQRLEDWARDLTERLRT